MSEAVLVRVKDGIVRNCPVAQVSKEVFRRNNDEFVSRCHLNTKGGTVHCCELKANEIVNNLTVPFLRTLPSPFNKFLLFGDVLFVLVDQREKICNFGQNDFSLIMKNQHPEFSPGTILGENQQLVDVEKADAEEEDESDVDDDDDDLTLQTMTGGENTTGTFLTHETSDDDARDDYNNAEDVEGDEGGDEDDNM
jgi:hypothetical protein